MGFTRDIPTSENIPDTAVRRDSDGSVVVTKVYGDLEGNARTSDDGITAVEGADGLIIAIEDKTLVASVDPESIFDQSLNTTDSPAFAQVTASLFDGPATDIEGLLEQSKVVDLVDDLTSMSDSISAIQGSLSSYATTSALSALESTVNSIQSSLSGYATTSALSALESSLSNYVTTSTFSALESTVSTISSSLSGYATTSALDAVSSSVSSLSSTVSSVQSDLSTLSSTVSGKINTVSGTSGNFAALDGTGHLSDSGYSSSSFASSGHSHSFGDITGSVSDGQLSSNVPLKDATNTFSVTQTFPAIVATSINFGNGLDDTKLTLYDNGSGTKYGAGVVSGAFQFFAATGDRIKFATRTTGGVFTEHFNVGNDLPYAKLFGAQGTGSAGTEQSFTIVRPVTVAVSWPQVVDFRVGRYSSSGVGPDTRLDFVLKADESLTQAGTATVMTLEARGRCGVNNTSPSETLSVGGNAQVSGQFVQTSQALSDGANISWNMNSGAAATVTLGGNRTLDNPTNIKAGGTYILTVTQDGTGSRTLSYGTAFKWSGGGAPVLSTTAGAIDVLTFFSPNGTNLYGAIQKGFA